MNFASRIRMILISSFAVFSSNLIYANLISSQELDSIVKDDIANAQAFLQACPSFVEDMTQIKHNIDQFTQENLTRLSTPMTLPQLQTDAEYQNALKISVQEQSSYSDSERKAGCQQLNDPAALDQ